MRDLSLDDVFTHHSDVVFRELNDEAVSLHEWQASTRSPHHEATRCCMTSEAPPQTAEHMRRGFASLDTVLTLPASGGADALSGTRRLDSFA